MYTELYCYVYRIILLFDTTLFETFPAMVVSLILKNLKVARNVIAMVMEIPSWAFVILRLEFVSA